MRVAIGGTRFKIIAKSRRIGGVQLGISLGKGAKVAVQTLTATKGDMKIETQCFHNILLLKPFDHHADQADQKRDHHPNGGKRNDKAKDGEQAKIEQCQARKYGCGNACHSGCDCKYREAKKHYCYE